MRLAIDVDYEVGTNEEITQMVDHFKGLLIEAIPTSGDTRFTMKLIADVQG